MFDVILAMTKNGGIGKENSLPWRCREELNIFKKITGGDVDAAGAAPSILICGRKTAESLPVLKHRLLITVSRNENLQGYVVGSVEKALSDSYRLQSLNGHGKIFIIGGKEIYDYVFKNLSSQINRVYLSVMKNDYECTHFIEEKFSSYHIVEKFSFEEFEHYILKKNTFQTAESSYLSLLRNVKENGRKKVGRNGNTTSIFFQNMSFDLTKEFPLLTTKRMFFRGIIEELLFFLRGDIDTKLLEEKGVNIWKGNTSREFLDKNGWPDRKEGNMGEMYGWQWRRFGEEEGNEETSLPSEENDMLYKVVRDIIDVRNGNLTASRRLLLTSFNPKQAPNGVLYPCHSIVIQFNVEGGDSSTHQPPSLDMITFNRSQDMFHGVPFNMAMASLLLIIIGKICGCVPRMVNMTMGDCHEYEDHASAIEEQLTRIPFSSPKLINHLPSLECNSQESHISHSAFCEYITSLNANHFEILDYSCFPSIKTPMIA